MKIVPGLIRNQTQSLFSHHIYPTRPLSLSLIPPLSRALSFSFSNIYSSIPRAAVSVQLSTHSPTRIWYPFLSLSPAVSVVAY